jgi:Mus7/MMS22 family
VVSDSEDSGRSPSPVRPARRLDTPDFSSSSSSSDTDQIERLKKRARGVLPGSFFTVQTKPLPKPAHRNTNASNAQDQDRRGVAKTKVGTGAPSRFAYPIDSDSDEPAPRRDREPSPPREKRNFIDLTREEKIQDDFMWDVEEDLIDRMLNWGGSSTRRTTHKPRPKRSKTLTAPKTKRKRQRRINEYTVPTDDVPTDTIPTAPKTKKTTAKRGPRLSIVDACDVYSARADRSPPQFMKLARRQSKRAENFGRRKPPSRQMFSFAEEEDREDVHTVITEWKNGTIAEGVERRTWVKPTKPLKNGGGAARVVRGGTKKKSIRRKPLAPLNADNVPSEDDEGQRDPPRPEINKFIRPGAPIIAIVDGTHSRGRVLLNNAQHSTGQIEGVTRTRLPPPPPIQRPCRPDDIATWLRKTAIPQRSDDDGAEDDTNGFQDTTEMIPEPHQRRPKPRVRKPRAPHRHDVNKFDNRFRRPSVTNVDLTKSIHQLSLDDVWFPNDSSSLTFGVVPVTGGVYLDSNTLLGRRLLITAMKTKPAVETENQPWSVRETRPTMNVDVASDKLAADIDEILDSIDGLRLSGDTTSITRNHRQVLTFAEFTITYLSRLSSGELNAIQQFGSKLLRLTEIAMDRLDGTVLAGTLDLNDPLVLLGLSVLQTLFVGSYQLCILTAHDVSMLGADDVMSKLGRRLLQYLLNGGFDPLQQVFRKMRAKNTQNEELGCDSILADVWTTLYHILESRSDALGHTIPTFWSILQSELDIGTGANGKILDRAWYTIMNVSAITLFDAYGIARASTHRTNTTNQSRVWTIVETIINPYLQSYSTIQHHRYDAYIRTLFGRCHTLIALWGWTHGAKNLLTTFYTFFTDRRFDNLKTEAFGGFPKFFQSDASLDIQTTDNTFVIFLKLVVSYITQAQSHTSTLDRRASQAATKDLDRFLNRITPLRTYQSTFAPVDYIALQNHYCLLLTLYWIAPERSRPSVERMRDVIDIEKAPAPAQVICMETWSLLAQLQLKRKEDVTSTVDWFLVMFRHSMREYLDATKVVEDEAVGQNKSKIRALEGILLKSLQSLGDVVTLAAEVAGVLVEGTPVVEELTLDVTGLVVKSSHQLPASVMNALLVLLKSFLSSVEKSQPSAPPEIISLDQDSQDYGDASFLEEFAAAQDQSGFPIGTIISSICTHLYQLVANLFASQKPTSDNLAFTIDNWILGISILVRHRQQDWATFLQYGGDWERLRSTNSRTSRAWCPYILNRVLSSDPSVYFQGRDHFISAWFESIIEPNLERQHAFTALLLNIDDENMVLGNSLFTKNSAGVYEITSDALFEARPALIVRMSLLNHH